jgi:type II secretory pathway component PulF
MSALSRSPGSFFFVAAKAGGGRALGLRQAQSERALADVLRRERLLLLRSYRLPRWASAPERGLLLRDRAELNEQLAQLLSRGVPLVEALEVVASSVRPPARPTIQKMRELVAAGSSFSDACQKTGAFDRVTVAVYRAAERTGDLAGAARQLAVNTRRQLAVSGKAATLMIYPAVVMGVSSVVLVMLLTILVPIIGRSLEQMRIRIPWYTEIVMAVGQALRNNILIMFIVVGVLLIGAILGRTQVMAASRRFMRRVPLMRDVVLAQESARFFSVMAAMTRSGVPLADALGVANEAVSLPSLRRQLETLRTRLIEGGILRTLIENVSELPLATRRLLIAAERSGDLETAFDGLASDMADEVDQRSSRLLAALEPLLIVAMFLIIGSVLLAIMIPIIGMASRAI